MRLTLDKRTIEYIYLGILLVIASALILSNLGNCYLWQDEAQTALIAKTVLTHGIPMGSDGVNSFSQLFGQECDKNGVWIWHPWFPFYLLAGFFALFGASTFIARLPFALFGIATVLLAYYFGKALWGSRRSGLIAGLLLMLSVPFLILVRQCRYYSPEVFFSLMGLYAYHGILERRRHAPIFFAVSAFLLFHTHYVQCAALLAAVAVHSLVFRRDRLRTMLLLCGLTVVINLPWIIRFAGMGNVVQGYGQTDGQSAQSAGYFLASIPKYIFPPTLLLLAAGTGALEWFRKKQRPAVDGGLLQNLALMILFSATSLAALIPTASFTFFRYLAPLIPVGCLIMALILDRSMRIHPVVGVVALGFLVWLAPLPMSEYLYEITHDYDGPVEGTVKYLNEHAHKGDLIAVSHEDLPLKFYTGFRYIGGSTGEDMSPTLNAQWIVMRQTVATTDYEAVNYLLKKIPWSKYQPVYLDYPDIAFENREDPAEHLFRTVMDAGQVIIFHRVRK